LQEEVEEDLSVEPVQAPVVILLQLDFQSHPEHLLRSRWAVEVPAAQTQTEQLLMVTILFLGVLLRMAVAVVVAVYGILQVQVVRVQVHQTHHIQLEKGCILDLRI
jgi:hypothetical protein